MMFMKVWGYTEKQNKGLQPLVLLKLPATFTKTRLLRVETDGVNCDGNDIGGWI